MEVSGNGNCWLISLWLSTILAATQKAKRSTWRKRLVNRLQPYVAELEKLRQDLCARAVTELAHGSKLDGIIVDHLVWQNWCDVYTQKQLNEMLRSQFTELTQNGKELENEIIQDMVMYIWSWLYQVRIRIVGLPGGERTILAPVHKNTTVAEITLDFTHHNSGHYRYQADHISDRWREFLQEPFDNGQLKAEYLGEEGVQKYRQHLRQVWEMIEL